MGHRFLSLEASNVLCKRVRIQRIYFRGLLSVVSVIRYCLYLFYSTLPKHQSRRKLQVLECMKCLIFFIFLLVKKPGRLNQVVVILPCHTCRKLLFSLKIWHGRQFLPEHNLTRKCRCSHDMIIVHGNIHRGTQQRFPRKHIENTY